MQVSQRSKKRRRGRLLVRLIRLSFPVRVGRSVHKRSTSHEIPARIAAKPVPSNFALRNLAARSRLTPAPHEAVHSRPIFQPLTSSGCRHDHRPFDHHHSTGSVPLGMSVRVWSAAVTCLELSATLMTTVNRMSVPPPFSPQASVSQSETGEQTAISLCGGMTYLHRATTLVSEVVTGK